VPLRPFDRYRQISIKKTHSKQAFCFAKKNILFSFYLQFANTNWYKSTKSSTQNLQNIQANGGWTGPGHWNNTDLWVSNLFDTVYNRNAHTQTFKQTGYNINWSWTMKPSCRNANDPVSIHIHQLLHKWSNSGFHSNNGTYTTIAFWSTLGWSDKRTLMVKVGKICGYFLVRRAGEGGGSGMLD
jgi:hypothetical protein